MGMFGQHLKRSSKTSVPPQTKLNRDGLAFHEDKVRQFTPVKLNLSSSSFEGINTKKVPWSHRSWNKLKKQPKAAMAQKSRQIKTSECVNDTDVMVPANEEVWNIENDDEVALLSTPIPSFIEPLFSETDEEEMFQVISPLSATSFVSSGNPSTSTERSFSTPTMSTEKTPSIWKRVPILKHRSLLKEKPILSYNKKSHKEGIEIQFECFFEEDDENSENELFFQTRKADSNGKPPSTASLFRRTSVMQSWWTQTLGTVKRGCRMVPPIRPRPERSRTPGTAPLVPSDEESQEQITFEHLCAHGETSNSHEYDESSIEEDNCTIHHRNMFVEAPIQFHIPLDAEHSSWEENGSFQLNYFQAIDRDDFSVSLAFV